MKNVEKVIKDKFIELLETRNIDEIDVQLLSSELKITRQAFYYHYKNIYDLVSDIILDHKIEAKEDATLNESIDVLLNAYYNNEVFYKELLRSSAKDILEEYTYAYFYKVILKYLSSERKLTVDARIDVCMFLSFGASNLMLNYFKNDSYGKEDVKIKVEAFLNGGVIKSIVEGYLNNI